MFRRTHKLSSSPNFKTLKRPQEKVTALLQDGRLLKRQGKPKDAFLTRGWKAIVAAVPLLQEEPIAVAHRSSLGAQKLFMFA